MALCTSEENPKIFLKKTIEQTFLKTWFVSLSPHPPGKNQQFRFIVLSNTLSDHRIKWPRELICCGFWPQGIAWAIPAQRLWCKHCCKNKVAAATAAAATKKVAAAVFEMLQTHYAYYPRFKHIGLATFFLTAKNCSCNKKPAAAVLLKCC